MTANHALALWFAVAVLLTMAAPWFSDSPLLITAGVMLGAGAGALLARSNGGTP